MNCLDEHFDDVRGAETRDEPEHSERNVNLEHAGHMRGEIERHHGKESCATSFVESINCQLYAIDVMAPAAQKSGTETTARQSIDYVGQQRDPLTRRHRRGNQPEKRYSRYEDEHFAGDRRYRIREQ